jgi:ABC-type glycerol-3-phosphate transport system substrate-binding protein
MGKRSPATVTRRQLFRTAAYVGLGAAALPLIQACQSAAPPAPAPTTQSGAAAKPTTASAAPTAAPVVANQKVTIRLSPGNRPDFAPDDPVLLNWIQPYLAEHPNVEIKTEGYGDEPEAKLLTELLSGNPVNIWLTTRWGTLGRAVELGAVLDLSEHVKGWDYSTYKPEALKVGQIEGKQWAMPYGDVCDAFVTRRAAFEQASQKVGFDFNKAYNGTWTWEDDFEKVMGALSAPPDRYGMAAMGSSKNSIARWWFQCITQSYGYDIVADAGGGKLAATFVNDGTLAAAETYRHGVAQKFIPRDAVTWGFDEASNAWFAGTVETIIAGRWLKQNALKNVKEDFVALALPVSKSRPTTSWYAGNLHLAFIITKGIKDDATRQTCIDMVKSLASRPVQENLSKAGAVPFPVRTDIDPEKLYNEPYWPGMLNSFKTKTPPPTFPSHPKLEDVYTENAKAVGQILSDPSADPKPILEAAQKKAELLLQSA